MRIAHRNGQNCVQHFGKMRNLSHHKNSDTTIGRGITFWATSFLILIISPYSKQVECRIENIETHM